MPKSAVQILEAYLDYRVAEIQKKNPVEHILAAYKSNAPFIVTSSLAANLRTPSHWQYDKSKYNPSESEKQCRTTHNLSAHEFFIINNQNNLHWDSSHLKPNGSNLSTTHLHSAGKGLSCGAYTLLQIIKHSLKLQKLPKVDKALVDSGLKQKINTQDVNLFTAEEVRGFVSKAITGGKNDLIQKHKVPAATLDKSLKRVEANGTMIESDDIHYAGKSLGINIFEPNELISKVDRGYLNTQILLNLSKKAEKKPEVRHEEECSKLNKFLAREHNNDYDKVLADANAVLRHVYSLDLSAPEQNNTNRPRQAPAERKRRARSTSHNTDHTRDRNTRNVRFNTDNHTIEPGEYRARDDRDDRRNRHRDDRPRDTKRQDRDLDEYSRIRRSSYTAGSNNFSQRLGNNSRGYRQYIDDLLSADTPADPTPKQATKDDFFTDYSQKVRSGSFSHQDVSKLKEKGAVNKEMRTKDNDFISPLLISIHKKCPVSYATALIDAGADVNDQYHGTTALHFAVNNQQMDMIDMLLNKAPDLVNTHDSYGNTPLHYAVAGRVNTEITKKLIDNGASLLAANNKGNTPKDYAASMDDENVKKLFDIPDSKQQEHSKEKETGNDKNPTTPMNRSQKLTASTTAAGVFLFVAGLFMMWLLFNGQIFYKDL